MRLDRTARCGSNSSDVLAPESPSRCPPKLVVAVPPNNDSSLRADSARNPNHHSNLDVAGWLTLFDASGFEATTYQHFHPEMAALDFASDVPSRFDADDFQFVEVDAETLAANPTLTAIFILVAK